MGLFSRVKADVTSELSELATHHQKVVDDLDESYESAKNLLRTVRRDALTAAADAKAKADAFYDHEKALVQKFSNPE
jgi:hypothetical protein